MMLSTLTRSSRLLAMRRLPRVLGASRAASLGDALQSKERVEEERFVREREKKFFERKKLELETKLYEHELAEFEATVAPAMAEVEALLAEKGCMVSDDALEALARWKLDLYEDQVPAKKAV